MKFCKGMYSVFLLRSFHDVQIKDLRVNLKHCKQGEVIGVFCSRDPNYKTDTMYLIRHKKVVRQIAIKVPKERYVIIDVYGMCTCVKLLPLREAPIMPRNEDKRLPAPEKQVPIPVEDEQKVKDGTVCLCVACM